MKYDVIVVGGGAAGSTLASRLAEDADTSVLLLEAGNDYADPMVLPDDVKFGGTRYAEAQDSIHNWALRGTTTEEQGEIHVAQGKVIGGGSSINGQAMQRGFPEDFDNWAAMGNDEWSYDKVLPFYRKMENDLDIQDDYHGSDGPMPVRRRRSGTRADIQQAFHDACLAHGYSSVEDTNGPNPTGVGVSPTNNLGGIRMSAAMTHLNPMRHRLNLTVRGNVYVRRVLFEGTKTVGVEAESGGEIFTVGAEKVVLSSGAIRSPQLLMLSGVGPREHLQQFGIPVIHDSPGVGQGLWNHLSAHITYKVKDGKTLTGDLDAPHFGLHYTAEGSSYTNDMVLRSSTVVDEREEKVAGVRTRYNTGDVPADRGSAHLLHVGSARRVWIRAVTVVRPRRAAGVQLPVPATSERHTAGARWPAVCDTDAGGQTLSKTYTTSRINPTDEILSDQDAFDTWIRQTVGTARHVSGTCRMGPDGDAMAVVDQSCRVRGVEGLWVTDASVMPRVPRSGGIHPTVIMVAERVVDWIATG